MAMSIEAAVRRLDWLEQDGIPSLTSCDAEELNALAQSCKSDLAAAVRSLDDVEVHEATFESLKEIRDRVSKLRALLRSTHLEARRARAASQGRAARVGLLQSVPSKPVFGQAPKSKDDALMVANDEVSRTLHRTLQLMQQELERSVLSTQMLEDQSSLLMSTGQRYTSFSDLLTTSKSIIASMQQADVLDRFVILAALFFFFGVCLYILKRRIVDRGLHIVGLAHKVVVTTAARPVVTELALVSLVPSTITLGVVSSNLMEHESGTLSSYKPSLVLSFTAVSPLTTEALRPTTVPSPGSDRTCSPRNSIDL